MAKIWTVYLQDVSQDCSTVLLYYNIHLIFSKFDLNICAVMQILYFVH
jgi:hypothetical protein